SKPIFDLKEALMEPGTEFDREYLHEALADAVDHHFVSDVPVSLFLSAGRDSSTILALAAEGRSDPVHAVTLEFQEYLGTENDESELAAEVARQCHADHLIHRVSGDEFKGDIEALLSAMDQPTIDGANTYFVCKVAHKLGVRVSLSGLGADEMFGGYPSFRQIPKLTRALRWTKAAPGLGRGVRSAASRLGIRRSLPKFPGLLEYGGTIEGAYLLRRGLFMPWELGSILDADMLNTGLEELAILDRLRAITCGLPTDYAKVMALESSVYMRHRLLRDSDWASMAHSLELRVPFVDIELMRRLGPWIASGNPPTKDAMARSPKQQLPEAVLNRPKTGFNVPIAEWALQLEPNAPREHSFRQWARYVYKRQSGGEHLLKPLPLPA
ncbi:MAG TPA: asparagine synthase C-terminal domain-containing protein, partial [Fimbriimonadaceae bacterium]|nr:asparagine synthase C-terminal domain-containing protein [Fimbriimonadaceae bacterium]